MTIDEVCSQLLFCVTCIVLTVFTPIMGVEREMMAATYEILKTSSVHCQPSTLRDCTEPCNHLLIAPMDRNFLPHSNRTSVF